MQHSVIKSQGERLAEELKKMSVDVTTADRKLFQKEYGFTKATVSRYLNGTVLDSDTAASMVSFFRNRINEREKALTK